MDEFFTWVDENVVSIEADGWHFFTEDGKGILSRKTFAEVFEYWKNIK